MERALDGIRRVTAGALALGLVAGLTACGGGTKDKAEGTSSSTTVGATGTAAAAERNESRTTGTEGTEPNGQNGGNEGERRGMETSAAEAAAINTDTPAPALNPTTKANVLEAMHGEANAFSKYVVFAMTAEREKKTAAADLFFETAGVERQQHFAEEAALVGLVGTDEANLKDAVAGETNETTTVYPGLAAKARAAGDTKVATLFEELAKDEAAHRDAFQKALGQLPSGALKNENDQGQNGQGEGRNGQGGQGEGERETTPTTAPGTTISAATKADVETAAKNEAFAAAKYMLFAAKARKSGLNGLADLFMRTGEQEREQHWAELTAFTGAVGTTAANLQSAISGEDYETTTMYPGFASAAKTAGDTVTADRLTEIAKDEAGHRDAFKAAAAKLG